MTDFSWQWEIGCEWKYEVVDENGEPIETWYVTHKIDTEREWVGFATEYEAIRFLFNHLRSREKGKKRRKHVGKRPRRPG